MLRGSDHEDCLNGNNDGDTFHGLAGDDVIDGRGGTDTVRYDRDARHGGAAGVTVDLGSNGADRITGINGKNTFNGGSGNDRLDGGGGADRFDFSGNFGRDRVFDFLEGGDKIDLRGVASITSYRDPTRKHLSTSGDDLRIDAGGGNVITLLDVDRSGLSADDFLF
jgi:serralysin